MNPHTLGSCPLRSMAWLTLHDQCIVSASKEWIQMIGMNPIGCQTASLWRRTSLCSTQSTYHVRLLHRPISLIICTHQHSDKTTLVCLDVTHLENIIRCKDQKFLSILRITSYGTISAYLSTENLLSPDCIGSPLMRYVHNDDVGLLCHHLRQASDTRTAFCLRLENRNATYELFNLTILTNKGELLCLVHPAPTVHTYATKTPPHISLDKPLSHSSPLKILFTILPLNLKSTFLFHSSNVTHSLLTYYNLLCPLSAPLATLKQCRETVRTYLLFFSATAMVTLKRAETKPLLRQMWHSVWNNVTESIHVPLSIHDLIEYSSSWLMSR
ncbi:hypothetical protein BDF14DRAFT_1823647 [Spinellus fusiger]|nr:hypothetical protein BDF14DRAFT_1823647 [Spinellus fusiger]